ncbi:Single-stranded DNA-binding replication protein A [Methanothrix harundinacea]|uniref:Single-stranded DNA-binding replication protein A n=1 Tax=Methanothrix harundinacea (strain 6Ac) TaxID=1110509 RepID=G7WKJ7_METH6|nr:Single-stranded DNA-binding replication protein A [Methanothrix harundinacea]AET63476.1 Single-stranded DNA-binding replication protein A [Methanothrix harundinacea 6Ac]
MNAAVEQILARLRNQKVEVPASEVESRLALLVEKFGVPEGEAVRSVVNYFLKEHGISPTTFAPKKAEILKVGEIDGPGRWIDLEAKVVELWEPTSSAISQTGLLGDETGTIKFVKWTKADLPELEAGKSYLFKNAVTDEFQGKFSVKLNRTSGVEELTKVVAAAEPSASSQVQEMKVSEIKEEGRWIDLRAKVVQLWEPTSETISQTGLIGDETGTIKFVKWAKSGIPDLAEGKSYLFKNLVTDEFQGRFSVKLNRTSGVEPLEAEVEASDAPGGQVQEMKISQIGEEGRWIDLRAKVVQLWDPTSETISQTGLIGDETGVIKFVKWAKSEIPDLAEGKSYLFKNVVTDEFEGRFSVKLNRTSEILPLEEEVEVSPQEANFTGAIVDVQKGSGLIKRCPICRRMLNKGVCGEHGKQEGTYDLRIKAVLDDGVKVQEVLINRERTESLMGISMEEAKTMAMEALDHEVVKGMIEERLLGRYYTVSGPTVDRYILVEMISPARPATAEEAEDLAARAGEVI